jgi:hypothetical protein
MNLVPIRNVQERGLQLMDILSLDATDQLRALVARELLEASVVRMDRLNPKAKRSGVVSEIRPGLHRAP